MARLSSREIESFNRAALEIHATRTAQELPWQIHQAIRTTLSGEMVGVNWVNPLTSVSLACRYFPEDVISEEQNALGQALLPLQLPMWLQCANAPHSVSEFISRRSWMQRDIFWALREFSLEEHLVLDIPITGSLTLMIADLRGRFGTFTDAERLRLKLLGPHVRQVCHRLARQGGPLVQTQTVSRRARVDVDPTGQLMDLSDEARALLTKYGCAVTGTRLPEKIRAWFLAQQSILASTEQVNTGLSAMLLSHGSRSLRLHLRPGHLGKGCYLILQEMDGKPEDRHLFAEEGVSPRESEVLHWAAQGKTNSEIATILGISSGTVKRHLENAYPKLGVENRHAATVLVVQASETRGFRSFMT